MFIFVQIFVFATCNETEAVWTLASHGHFLLPLLLWGQRNLLPQRYIYIGIIYTCYSTIDLVSGERYFPHIYSHKTVNARGFLENWNTVVSLGG